MNSTTVTYFKKPSGQILMFNHNWEYFLHLGVGLIWVRQNETLVGYNRSDYAKSLPTRT